MKKIVKTPKPKTAPKKKVAAKAAPKRGKRPVKESKRGRTVTGVSIRAVVKAMASEKATIDDAARALTEAVSLSTGSKVYIGYGSGAGNRGTLKSIHKDSGYATVHNESTGDYWFIPTIFLLNDENGLK